MHTAYSFQSVYLGLVIAFASAGIMQKYAGLAGLAAYTSSVLITLFLLRKYREQLPALLTANPRTLGALLIAVLIGIFAILYPIENSRGLGKSSDRDQGLNLAAERLVHGEYPYYPKDDFAGPLSVLPGSILFATPFAILGNSAFQNFFWIASLLVVTARFLRDPSLSVILIGACIFLSPSAMHEFISGGDLLSNGIFVAVLGGLALDQWTKPVGKISWLVVATVFLGIALSSRPNFLFLLPLLCMLVWKTCGFPRAFLCAMAVFGTTCLVTLPFYTFNPDGFTPLIARAKIHIPGLSWASSAVVTITAFASLALSLLLFFRKSNCILGTFFLGGTAILLCPMVTMVILISISKRNLDFSFMNDRFGVMYLPFALLAWGTFSRNQSPCASSLPCP